MLRILTGGAYPSVTQRINSCALEMFKLLTVGPACQRPILNERLRNRWIENQRPIRRRTGGDHKPAAPPWPRRWRRRGCSPRPPGMSNTGPRSWEGGWWPGKEDGGPGGCSGHGLLDGELLAVPLCKKRERGVR